MKTLGAANSPRICLTLWRARIFNPIYGAQMAEIWIQGLGDI